MSGGDLDWQLLGRLIGLARDGDTRGVLGLPSDADPQTFHLTDPVLKHSYESLLAWVVAGDLGEFPDLDDEWSDAWGIVEWGFFDHDDDGYAMQWLNEGAATVFSTDRLGLADPVRARQRWEAALEGPYPEGAQEQLDALVPSMAPAVRAGLEGLITR
ncbi:hypothetical protein [Streptomyces sp. NPDC018693]|uniref:hypothetical protein n=1 Tax=unclassified Streptomyces TaxID=2593676 RepID=UPI00378F8A01